MGAHGGSEAILRRFLMDFGLLLESPGDHLGRHFGTSVSNWSIYVDVLVLFFGVSKTGAKKMPKVVKKGVLLEAVDRAQVW